MKRIAVIGDIGGHADELYAALVGLGADPHSLRFPDDLIVVQVGDLVHRGPNSTGVLDMVEQQLEAGSWVQLLGNHEANEVAPPTFEYEVVSDSDRDRLCWWRESGQLRAAAVILDRDHGDVLVTHAGLTASFYDRLGRPPTAHAVAERLDRLLATDDGFDTLCRPGLMLGGKPDSDAGPIWAHGGLEVCPSWLHRSAPFHQVHGHTSMYRWSRGTYQAPDDVADRTVVDRQRRHARTTVAGDKYIWSIDPGLGAYAGCRWQPLVFRGRVTFPS